MKKLYKLCKEDLEELYALMVGDPDSGHGAFISISDECTGATIDLITGMGDCVRTVFINGKKTHFTEALYQQLFAHGVITLKEKSRGKGGGIIMNKNKWRVEGLYFLPTELVTFTVSVRARSMSKAINLVRRWAKRMEFPKRVDYFTVTKISKD